MSATIIAPLPPSDGKRWECQCARCGSSMSREECWQCGGEGVDGHDCGDDCCPCADPEENVTCGTCGGHGGWHVCLSSEAFCRANTIKGREDVERGDVEWFLVPCEPSPAR